MSEYREALDSAREWGVKGDKRGMKQYGKEGHRGRCVERFKY